MLNFTQNASKILEESIITYTPPKDIELQLYDFYVVEILYHLIQAGPAPERKHLELEDSDDLWVNVQEAVETLIPSLAERLKKALFQAVGGELRYMKSAPKHDPIIKYYFKDYALRQVPQTGTPSAWSRVKKNGYEETSNGRAGGVAAAIKTAKKYGPIAFMEAASWAFYKASWSPSYGGKAWGNIADAWLKLYQATKLKDQFIVIDHVLDLEHNNNVVFDKIPSFSKNGDFGWIKEALDFKYEAALPTLIEAASSQMRRIALPVIQRYNPRLLTQRTEQPIKIQQPIKPKSTSIFGNNPATQSKQEFDKAVWLKRHKHEVHEDGSISVFENVNLSNQKLKKLPFVFRKVTGNFYCDTNQLTSLSGAPAEVGGNFYCDNNQLTSLAGAPTKVGGHFFCDNNQLTSLEGAPAKVGGSFSCTHNQLTSLSGAPSEVGGNFDCANNQIPKEELLKTLTQNPKESSVGAPMKKNDKPERDYPHITNLTTQYTQYKGISGVQESFLNLAENIIEEASVGGFFKGVGQMISGAQKGINYLHQTGQKNDPTLSWKARDKEPFKALLISAEHPPKKGEVVVHSSGQNQPWIFGQVVAVNGANFQLKPGSIKAISTEKVVNILPGKLASLFPNQTTVYRAWVFGSEGFQPATLAEASSGFGNRNHQQFFQKDLKELGPGNWKPIPNIAGIWFGPDYEIPEWFSLRNWLRMMSKTPPNSTTVTPTSAVPMQPPITNNPVVKPGMHIPVKRGPNGRYQSLSPENSGQTQAKKSKIPKKKTKNL